MMHQNVIVVAHAIVTACAAAQEKPAAEPPQLVAAREEHLRAMQRASVPLLQAYAAKLNRIKQVLGREGKFEAGVAVENELREVTRQLEAARTLSDPTRQPSAQLSIVSATFGDAKGKRTVNVEAIVKQMLAAGKTTFRVGNDVLNNDRDPAPYAKKELTITYIIGGAKKEKSFDEKAAVDLKNDLK